MRSGGILANNMMCSGPFRGAQGHNNFADAQRDREGGHMYWKRGEVASRAYCFRQLFLLLLYYGSTLLRTNIAGGGSCTSSKLLPTTDLLHCSITNVRCSATNVAHGVKFLWGGCGAGGLVVLTSKRRAPVSNRAAANFYTATAIGATQRRAVLLFSVKDAHSNLMIKYPTG